MNKINDHQKKKFWMAVPILLFIIWTGCDVVEPDNMIDNTNHSASAAFKFQVSAQNKNHLSITGINGPISITGVTSDTSIVIWGKRKVESESEEDAFAFLEKVQVSLFEGSNEVEVETIQPDQTQGRNVTVDYHAEIPLYWSVDVKLTNGEISVDSLENTVTVELVNGNTNLNQIFGNVFANVVNGQVVGNMTLPPQGTFDLATVNGQINLTIPKNTSASFSANVTNGSIQINELTLANIIQSNTSLQGILGNGNGRIKLKTTNGNIYVEGAE